MTTRNYEAMFILENNAATADFEATAAAVDEVLQKHGATIVQKEKWDERKLAYEIKGQRRGTYYLVYFTSAPASLAGMTEDLQLTEVVLRHMFIALNVPIDEHISTTATERERLAEDSRRSSLGWGGGGGRRERRGAPPAKDAPAPAKDAAAKTEEPAETEEPAKAEAPAKADESASSGGEAEETSEKEAASKP